MQTDFTKEQEVTSHVQGIADRIKEAVEHRLKKKFNKFEVIKSAKASDVGTIHHLKIKVDDDNEHLHASVHEALPNEGGHVSLANVEEGKSVGDTF